MERNEFLRDQGYDPNTLVVSANAEYFYQGGDNWRRPFICKITGTAGNLERWDVGHLIEDADGVYDIALSASNLSASEATEWI